MHSACTVVDPFCVHRRPPLRDFSIRAARRRTWVHSSWDFLGEWDSLVRRLTLAGATQAYQITLEYQQTTILRPSLRHNLFSPSPSRNVNFCYPNRLHRSASCCRCNKIHPQTACITAPQTDRCRQIIIITITILQIIITPPRRDHRQSEVQMELTSAMSKIKILSVSCAVTRVQANTTDNLRAKVSVSLTVLDDRRSVHENPFKVINLGAHPF